MSARFVGHLEEPEGDPIAPDQFLPDGRLLVRGWAIGRSGSPVEVSARFDDGPRLRMLAAGVRDDVYLAHAAVPHAGRSGFVGILPAPAVATPTRPGRLLVEVRDRAGPWDTLATRTLAPSEPAVGPEEDDLELGGTRPGGVARLPGAEATVLRPLLVSQNFNLEGAPRSLLELGRQLRGAGMDLRVLGPVHGPLGNLWVREGARIEYVGDPGRIVHLDDYAQRIRRIAALEGRHRPDVVVANTLDTFWAVDLAEALGVPALWIIRESVDVEPYFLGRWPYEIARRALRALESAARVSFVAHATEAMFASRVPAARRGVIWNGLDLSRADAISKSTSRASARRHLGLPRDVQILVCVGSVCQRKGQHVLVEAIGRMAARSKAPVCVLVGARPSPYLEGLERRVGILGLEGLVRIVPETEDPFLYYRAADLFVCPSFEESLPRVVLEAMAFALPIVATNVYGIPEMIDDRSGWLVPPGDPDALAAAIEAVVDDPDAARQVGSRARERAENDFRIETMGQRYVEVLRGLAETGVAYGEAS